MVVASSLRSGPAYWLDSYVAMVRWQLASMRQALPTTLVVQVLAGVGFVYGFGLFFGSSIPPRSALYISTGVTVINLYLVGLILLPQIVGQLKAAKTYDYIRSMAAPRAVVFLAWWSVTLLVGVPALVVSVAAAALRYHQAFVVSPYIVPAVLLVSLCSLAIGYALGHAVAQPMMTNVLTQVLNFGAIGFAPVAIPPEQLPAWLQSVNHLLPFESMATIMRVALTGGSESVLVAYTVLGLWTCACLGIAGWSVSRRG